ncbi:MAG: helix-turn-helix transcriptional regulator [Flavisolibacter sp.]|jgi:DNA-binding transcriptional ArsR family regulator|nr:helix-turn-helix transcriptional regulator [Flavisolibacter sp.]
MEHLTQELLVETPAIKKAALVFRSINHPLRRQVLQFLHQEARMTVTQLYIKLRLEQSVVSQHLAILRKSGVVLTERQGKFIFYSINYSRLKQIHQIAAELIR